MGDQKLGNICQSPEKQTVVSNPSTNLSISSLCIAEIPWAIGFHFWEGTQSYCPILSS